MLRFRCHLSFPAHLRSAGWAEGRLQRPEPESPCYLMARAERVFSPPNTVLLGYLHYGLKTVEDRAEIETQIYPSFGVSSMPS
jgi:hypothetical protein